MEYISDGTQRLARIRQFLRVQNRPLGRLQYKIIGHPLCANLPALLLLYLFTCNKKGS